MRVLLLVHQRLKPPTIRLPLVKVKKALWRTEYDVYHALTRLGHKVLVVGLEDSLVPLAESIPNFSPDVVFNLLEEFSGQATWESHVVAFLEMNKLRYTGCNSLGLSLARNKAIAKILVNHAGIATPEFLVTPLKSDVGLDYPLIVKYLNEEASLALSQKSVVVSDRQLRKQIKFMQRRENIPVLVEEYIEGREFYVSVMGNDALTLLPPRELMFGRLPKSRPRIATRQLKWDPKFRRKFHIYTRTVRRSERELVLQLHTASRKVYKALKLSGYARMDFRLDRSNNLYFIEANPNPQVCRGEDFADAARASGLDYSDMLTRILKLARR